MAPKRAPTPGAPSRTPSITAPVTRARSKTPSVPPSRAPTPGAGSRPPSVAPGPGARTRSRAASVDQPGPGTRTRSKTPSVSGRTSGTTGVAGSKQKKASASKAAPAAKASASKTVAPEESDSDEPLINRKTTKKSNGTQSSGLAKPKTARGSANVAHDDEPNWDDPHSGDTRDQRKAKLERLRVPELKDLCGARRVAKTGKKADLIGKLLDTVREAKTSKKKRKRNDDASSDNEEDPRGKKRKPQRKDNASDSDEPTKPFGYSKGYQRWKAMQEEERRKKEDEQRGKRNFPGDARHASVSPNHGDSSDEVRVPTGDVPVRPSRKGGNKAQGPQTTDDEPSVSSLKKGDKTKASASRAPEPEPADTASNKKGTGKGRKPTEPGPSVVSSGKRPKTKPQASPEADQPEPSPKGDDTGRKGKRTTRNPSGASSTGRGKTKTQASRKFEPAETSSRKGRDTKARRSPPPDSPEPAPTSLHQFSKKVKPSPESSKSPTPPSKIDLGDVVHVPVQDPEPSPPRAETSAKKSTGTKAKASGDVNKATSKPKPAQTGRKPPGKTLPDPGQKRSSVDDDDDDDDDRPRKKRKPSQPGRKPARKVSPDPGENRSSDDDEGDVPRKKPRPDPSRDKRPATKPTPEPESEGSSSDSESEGDPGKLRTGRKTSAKKPSGSAPPRQPSQPSHPKKLPGKKSFKPTLTPVAEVSDTNSPTVTGGQKASKGKEPINKNLNVSKGSISVSKDSTNDGTEDTIEQTTKQKEALEERLEQFERDQKEAKRKQKEKEQEERRRKKKEEKIQESEEAMLAMLGGDAVFADDNNANPGATTSGAPPANEGDGDGGTTSHEHGSHDQGEEEREDDNDDGDDSDAEVPDDNEPHTPVEDPVENPEISPSIPADRQRRSTTTSSHNKSDRTSTGLSIDSNHPVLRNNPDIMPWEERGRNEFVIYLRRDYLRWQNEERFPNHIDRRWSEFRYPLGFIVRARGDEPNIEGYRLRRLTPDELEDRYPNASWIPPTRRRQWLQVFREQERKKKEEKKDRKRERRRTNLPSDSPDPPPSGNTSPRYKIARDKKGKIIYDSSGNVFLQNDQSGERRKAKLIEGTGEAWPASGDDEVDADIEDDQFVEYDVPPAESEDNENEDGDAVGEDNNAQEDEGEADLEADQPQAQPHDEHDSIFGDDVPAGGDNAVDDEDAQIVQMRESEEKDYAEAQAEHDLGDGD